MGTLEKKTKNTTSSIWILQFALKVEEPVKCQL